MNKSSGRKNVPLQLNIDPEIRKQFRIYAAKREMDMSVLFVEMFQAYRNNHHGSAEKDKAREALLSAIAAYLA